VLWAFHTIQSSSLQTDSNSDYAEIPVTVIESECRVVDFHFMNIELGLIVVLWT